MTQLNDKQKRERKFLLVLPILTLPFLCLAFWALGGGNGILPMEDELEKGLNMSLPEARIEVDELDKLESYEQAERKASRLREQRRMDPFAEIPENVDAEELMSMGQGEDQTLEATENSVREKLADLEGLIASSEETSVSSINKTVPKEPKPEVLTEDLELKRLESMMASVVDPEMVDPEMERIDAMLDKLLDVQHPQRVQERMDQLNRVRHSEVYSISTNPDLLLDEVDRRIVNGLDNRAGNGFYTLDEPNSVSFSEIKPAISAEVTIDQEIINGASIELKLAQDIYIRGEKLPKGAPLTGTCTLNGERLNIQVNAIRSGNLIIPVILEAMDLDALPGIRIPNAITRDAVKQGAGDGIQSMNMMTMSSSWEVQASMAGMEAVKGIFSKKAKLVKVKVKAGHPLLLADMSGQ